jgi:predicted TIM-barrel fold metal-dependent hydrolase
MIVDTHVHLASPDRSRYPVAPTGIGSPWWRHEPPFAESFAVEMGRAGVERAVIVQPVGAYGFDNSYVVDAAAALPGRLMAVVAVDLDAPEVESDIGRLAGIPAVTGVRFFAMTAARRWVDAGTCGPMLEVATECGLTVVLTVVQADLPVLHAALAASPAPLVLDHCAFPQYVDGRVAAGQPVLRLAELPHVGLKVTTQCFEAAQGDGRALLEQLTERFGSQRLVWGSDFPQTHSRYGEAVSSGRRACGGLDPDSQAAYMGANASRLFFAAPSAFDPQLLTARRALAPLVETLATDGYHLEIASREEGPFALHLRVTATAEACADCLVPEAVFAGIATDRLRATGVEVPIVVTYPASEP